MSVVVVMSDETRQVYRLRSVNVVCVCAQLLQTAPPSSSCLIMMNAALMQPGQPLYTISNNGASARDDRIEMYG